MSGRSSSWKWGWARSGNEKWTRRLRHTSQSALKWFNLRDEELTLHFNNEQCHCFGRSTCGDVACLGIFFFFFRTTEADFYSHLTFLPVNLAPLEPLQYVIRRLWWLSCKQELTCFWRWGCSIEKKKKMCRIVTHNKDATLKLADVTISCITTETPAPCQIKQRQAGRVKTFLRWLLEF